MSDRPLQNREMGGKRRKRGNKIQKKERLGTRPQTGAKWVNDKKGTGGRKCRENLF